MLYNKPQPSQIVMGSTLVLGRDKNFVNVAGVELSLKKGSKIKIVALGSDTGFQFEGKEGEIFDDAGNTYGSVVHGEIDFIQGDFDFVNERSVTETGSGVAGMEQMLGEVAAELNDNPRHPKINHPTDIIHNPKEDIASKKTADYDEDDDEDEDMEEIDSGEIAGYNYKVFSDTDGDLFYTSEILGDLIGPFDNEEALYTDMDEKHGIESKASKKQAGDKLTVLKYENSDDYFDPDQAGTPPVDMIDAPPMPEDDQIINDDSSLVDLGVTEASKKTVTASWQKSDITEFLDAIGQDDINFGEGNSGVANGDFGKVSFEAPNGINTLYLNFQDYEGSIDNLAVGLDQALGNPYDFYTRPDIMPHTVMVQFTEGFDTEASKKQAAALPPTAESAARKVAASKYIIYQSGYMEEDPRKYVIDAPSIKELVVKIFGDLDDEADQFSDSQLLDLVNESNGDGMPFITVVDQNNNIIIGTAEEAGEDFPEDFEEFDTEASKKTANVPDDNIIEGKYGDVYGMLELKDGTTIKFNGEPDSFDALKAVDPKTIENVLPDLYVELKDGTKILLEDPDAVEDYIMERRSSKKVRVRAGFESHLWEKLDEIGVSRYDWELDYDNKGPYLIPREGSSIALDSESAEAFIQGIKPDFNAEWDNTDNIIRFKDVSQGSKKVRAYFQVGDMIKKIQDVDDKPKEVKKVYFDAASNTQMYDVETLGKITDVEIEQYQKVGKSETPSIWQPGKNKRDDVSKHGYEGEMQPKDLKKLPRKSAARKTAAVLTKRTTHS